MRHKTLRKSKVVMVAHGFKQEGLFSKLLELTARKYDVTHDSVAATAQ